MPAIPATSLRPALRLGARRMISGAVTALIGLVPLQRAVAQGTPADPAVAVSSMQEELSRLVQRRYQGSTWGILSSDQQAEDSATVDRMSKSLSSLRRQGTADPKLASAAGNLAAFLDGIVGARACHDDLLNVDQLNGIQSEIAFTLAMRPLGSDSARASLLHDAAQVPLAIRTLLANLDHGVALGLSAPRSTVERVIEQLGEMVAGDGKALLSPADRDEDAGFRASWTTLVRDSVLPALQSYHHYLSTRYLARARSEAGLAALSGGAECYRARVFQTSGMHPDLDALYLEAVARRVQLTERIRIAGAKLLGTPLSAVDVMRTIRGDPRFVMHDPDSIVAAYAADVGRARAALPRLFSRIPHGELVVKAIPQAQAATAPPARYDAAQDGSNAPSIFFVNAYQPGGIARMNITMGVVHEGYPGHHFQHLYAGLDPSSRASSTFAANGAYMEGWGIYSERLADEVGLFDSELTRLGYLTHLLDVFMALQLDIGMHARGWTRAQVVDSMMAVAGRSKLQAESYADRHAASPGQLASYGIGYFAIAQARESAERQLGKRFDLRAFHDVVLSDGNVTLPELTARVDAWIRAQKGR